MVKEINFTDVNPLKNQDIKNINNSILKIIKKKNFILGNEVNEFEKKFSKISKSKYSLGCGSGTDALKLALMSLNLKKDDEVIVPGLTYVSTGLSVILNNNKLVLADIDNETGLISLNSVKKKINKKTKVVIPVNLYGQRVNIKKLRKIVGKKIFIIEDSAQSHFAFDGNSNKIKKNIYADASCYSFYPAKNLGAYGDGGIITVNNKSLYERLLPLRNLGSVKKNKHTLIGLNSRLDTLQAVVLSNKINSTLNFNNKRRKIAKFYDKHLSSIKKIKITKTNKGSSRHLYVIRVKNRNNLIKYLLRKKIFCQLHYPYSLNKLEAFKYKIKNTKLKNAELWAKECVSLPIHPNLSINDASRVVNEVKKYFKVI
tara:strand:+ start:196 stop:1308 length:1113 start_codon:yes stop_codon:yes gene_type:complete